MTKRDRDPRAAQPVDGCHRPPSELVRDEPGPLPDERARSAKLSRRSGWNRVSCGTPARRQPANQADTDFAHSARSKVARVSSAARLQVKSAARCLPFSASSLARAGSPRIALTAVAISSERSGSKTALRRPRPPGRPRSPSRRPARRDAWPRAPESRSPRGARGARSTPPRANRPRGRGRSPTREDDSALKA